MSAKPDRSDDAQSSEYWKDAMTNMIGVMLGLAYSAVFTRELVTSTHPPKLSSLLLIGIFLIVSFDLFLGTENTANTIGRFSGEPRYWIFDFTTTIVSFLLITALGYEAATNARQHFFWTLFWLFAFETFWCFCHIVSDWWRRNAPGLPPYFKVAVLTLVLAAVVAVSAFGSVDGVVGAATWIAGMVSTPTHNMAWLLLWAVAALLAALPKPSDTDLRTCKIKLWLRIDVCLLLTDYGIFQISDLDWRAWTVMLFVQAFVFAASVAGNQSGRRRSESG
jgi:hypothetical protein